MPGQDQDDDILLPISDMILKSVGGLSMLKPEVGELLRKCIDGVIKTPKTGRRLYDDLEKTEKTYIGTCVEIDLRHRLKLARGKVLDCEIAGFEVDIKFSIGKSWMIPPEAFGLPCIIISADDRSARYRFGLFVARPEYLNAGNRDKKCSISKFGQENIRWLVKDEPYPPNFWQSVSRDVADMIASGRSGNERLVTLFREVRDRPISRKVIEDVAAQNDPMRRVRADKSRGTRNRLAKDGIVLLCGNWSGVQEFITKAGLPALGSSEFMSHQPSGDELTLAKELGLMPTIS
jgi:hypothetical protein